MYWYKMTLIYSSMIYLHIVQLLIYFLDSL